MAANPIVEPEEDLQLVKHYVLLPVLLYMLRRDSHRLMTLSKGIIFGYLIYSLKEMENLIISEIRAIEEQMRNRGVIIHYLKTDIRGLDVSFLAHGNKQIISLPRGLIKVELMIMFSDLWRRL